MSADCALTARMEDEAKRVRGTASRGRAPLRLLQARGEQGAMFVKIHGPVAALLFKTLDKIQKAGL